MNGRNLKCFFVQHQKIGLQVELVVLLGFQEVIDGFQIIGRLIGLDLAIIELVC